MEIILKEDIAGLGYKNDVVDVKPGYGRNYLIPQGVAIIASESNKKILQENLKQAAHKAEKIKQDAVELAEAIGDLSISLTTKAGESGKIFGSITTLQISDALSEKGFSIDRKKITLDSEVKHVGEYTATVDLHREVKHQIKLVIEAED